MNMNTVLLWPCSLLAKVLRCLCEVAGPALYARRAALLLALLLTLLAAACEDRSSRPSASATAPSSTVAPQAADKPRVGLMLYKKDPYISLVSQKVQQHFAGKATVMEYSADNDQVRQNRQVDELLASGIQVLLINLVDVQTGAGMVDKIRKAGIPAIFFNREPDLNILRGYKKSCFVGTRVEDAGALQGNIIRKLWESHPRYDRNKDGVFQFAMLQGPLDNPEAVGRTVHSVRRAQTLGVPMRQVGESHICDWDENLAAEAMRLALAVNLDTIELIISNNDSMALGAITALAELGFNREDSPPEKFIPVVGVDAIPAAVDAIRKGTMSATVEQDSESMAEALVALALNAATGKDFLAGTPYVWDENVAVRIPYKVFHANP